MGKQPDFQLQSTKHWGMWIVSTKENVQFHVNYNYNIAIGAVAIEAVPAEQFNGLYFFSRGIKLILNQQNHIYN